MKFDSDKVFGILFKKVKDIAPYRRKKESERKIDRAKTTADWLCQTRGFASAWNEYKIGAQTLLAWWDERMSEMRARLCQVPSDSSTCSPLACSMSKTFRYIIFVMDFQDFNVFLFRNRTLLANLWHFYRSKWSLATHPGTDRLPYQLAEMWDSNPDSRNTDESTYLLNCVHKVSYLLNFFGNSLFMYPPTTS